MSRGALAGLAAALVVVIALGTHVTHWSGLGGLLVPALVIGGIGALLGIGVRLGGAGAARTVHGHTANWSAAAAHEAGHAAVARHIGAGEVSARIQRSGAGWTSYMPPEHMPPVESIAVALAGGMGEGVSIDSKQCSGDKASIARDLRHAGWFSKGSVMARAEQLARQGLRAQSGYANRVERQLLRTGRSKRYW